MADAEEWRLFDLGNAPLSFQSARNVLLDPEYRKQAHKEVPYFVPQGGHAYLFLSSLPLSKLHPKFDPFKFLFLGKGFNKEFAVLKRYYHLKHNKTELNKHIYSFQRHIYCLAVDECDAESETLYLVHYFGNDYLLEDAPYRKNASIPMGVTKLAIAATAEPVESSRTEDSVVSEESFSPSRSAEISTVVAEIAAGNGCSSGEVFSPSAPVINNLKKRKMQHPMKLPTMKRLHPESNDTSNPATETKRFRTEYGLENADYLFAMNMAAQLQLLSKEMKAKVKFQIATVFYEAEMKTLNCPLEDCG